MACIYSASLQMSLHFEHNKEHYCAVQTARSGHTLTMLHVNISVVICIPQSKALLIPIVQDNFVWNGNLETVTLGSVIVNVRYFITYSK